jgi:hypothetical protein
VLMATIAPMMSTMAPPPPTTNVLTKQRWVTLQGAIPDYFPIYGMGGWKLWCRDTESYKKYNPSLLQHNCTRWSVVKI